MAKTANLGDTLSLIGAQSAMQPPTSTHSLIGAQTTVQAPAAAQPTENVMPESQGNAPASGGVKKKKKPPIGVMFRLDAGDHALVTKYADQKKMSVQELLEHAVNAMRRGEGLSEIKGRPRGKKAGSTAN